eukprot:453222_1
MVIHLFIAPTSTKTTYKMYVSFKIGPKTHTHEKRVPFCSCLDGWVTALRCEFVLWTTRVCFLTALHVIDVSLTHIIACGNKNNVGIPFEVEPRAAKNTRKNDVIWYTFCLVSLYVTDCSERALKYNKIYSLK